MKCDLHLHTSCSDGFYTPQRLVQLAKERKLDCIAITDHDTVVGVLPAVEEGAKQGVKVISGIEISTVYEKKEVHILGYNVDVTNEDFLAEMDRVSHMRDERNRLLVARLAEHGIEISLDDIKEKKKGESIGRAVIAQEMVRLGYCKDVPQAFEKYIGNGKPCYVRSERLLPEQAVELINRFGGVSVLAHPKNLHMFRQEFERFLQNLVKAGLKGIEAKYFSHTIPERSYYEKMARKYGLVITGGSDFHNHDHGVELGSKVFVPSNYTQRALKLL